MKLCSVCSPPFYADGNKTCYGYWHGRFDRIFLPKGEFVTNGAGHIEHRITGETIFYPLRLSDLSEM
jgi:hypothetical protein